MRLSAAASMRRRTGQKQTVQERLIQETDHHVNLSHAFVAASSQYTTLIDRICDKQLITTDRTFSHTHTHARRECILSADRQSQRVFDQSRAVI